MVFNLPLPIFEERNSYIRNTIVQLAILTAIIWGVVQAVNCVLAALKTKKPEQSKLDKKACMQHAGYFRRFTGGIGSFPCRFLWRVGAV